MHAHRFRHAAGFRRTASVATNAIPAAPAAAGFAVAVAAAPTPAVAELYRRAYEAALARVVARRRCSAPFSLN